MPDRFVSEPVDAVEDFDTCGMETGSPGVPRVFRWRGDTHVVTRVLRRDMTLSFYFQVLSPRSYLADPATEPLEAPSFPDWLNVGAAYLIKAEIKGAGPYDVEFRLFDVTNRKMIPVATQSFAGAGKGQLRTAAHRFASR